MPLCTLDKEINKRTSSTDIFICTEMSWSVKWIFPANNPLKLLRESDGMSEKRKKGNNIEDTLAHYMILFSISFCHQLHYYYSALYIHDNSYQYHNARGMPRCLLSLSRLLILHLPIIHKNSSSIYYVPVVVWL